jgi:hypothetical protein
MVESFALKRDKCCRRRRSRERERGERRIKRLGY